MFLDALASAVARRVEVRVLVDDVGARYTWPSIVRSLRRAGITVGKFLPTRLPWGFRYSNMRNHRKILVADGRIGFAGGMNIREGNMLATAKRCPIQDLHFRIDGPVVSHLQEVFAFDWRFCTGEQLEGDAWFPRIDASGEALARGISDGPDEDFDKSRLTLLGAISCARQSLSIVTPYFLPDSSLITSLCVAAMRGVSVDIVLPEKNNLTLVQWASMAVVGELVERGCRVWFSPPPFDHTKLMLVDELWSLIGSTNWDPRSLRLNFEFNVECYDAALAKRLGDFAQKKIDASRGLSLADIHGRNLAVKLRDGVARLASPYL
jgi:cardiolipin synthase